MLTYEMISGINPFKQAAMQGNKSRHDILRKITDQDVDILPGFSTNAADLLRGLLQRDPKNRLNIHQIQAHAFFASIDWDQLLAKKMTPPFVPNVKGAADVRNIDTDFTDEVAAETLVENPSLLNTVQIDEFTYRGDEGAFLDR